MFSLLLVAVLLSGHAHAISPRQLVEVIDIGEPVASPNGAKVAYRIERPSIERNTYDTVWYVQAIDGSSPPRKVGEGGIPLRDSAGVSLSERAVWSPDGRWIYFRAAIGGKVGVWRAAADGSVAERVTRDSADVRRFVLENDGKTLKYSVGAGREEVMDAEQLEYESGIRIDETVPIGQGLFRSGFVNGRLATQRVYHNEVERLPLLGHVPDRWKQLNIETGTVRAVTVPEREGIPEEDDPDYAAAWRSSRHPETGQVAVLTRVGELDGRVQAPGVELSVSMDVGESRVILCRHQLCTGREVTGIQWRPGSNEVLFTITDHAKGLAQSIYRWSVVEDEVHPVVNAQGLLNGGRDRLSKCAVTFAALVCVAADAGRPPRVEHVDIETGKRKVIFNPNRSLAFDYKRNVEVRLLTWSDDTGRRFSGQYFVAQRKENGPAPLFVSYYWCPGFLRGGYGDEWPLASLAFHGISALCINYDPLRVDAVERYQIGRSAVESVVGLLSSMGEVDRTKVGMGGLSFGTEVTLWTAMHSEMLSAVSLSSLAISPLFHLFLSNKEDTFFPRLREYWQLGTPEKTPERWQKISPTFNIDSLDAPMLMQLSEQEYTHTLDYAVPLMRSGHADLYVFPHEPHQKFQPRHKLAVYQRNLDWFRFWLLEVEDDSQAKQEQYENWRSMRSSSRAR